MGKGTLTTSRKMVFGLAVASSFMICGLGLLKGTLCDLFKYCSIVQQYTAEQYC